MRLQRIEEIRIARSGTAKSSRPAWESSTAGSAVASFHGLKKHRGSRSQTRLSNNINKTMSKDIDNNNQMENSDTPETDAVSFDTLHNPYEEIPAPDGSLVNADLCRKLERERNMWREKFAHSDCPIADGYRKDWAGNSDHADPAVIDACERMMKLERERNEAWLYLARIHSILTEKDELGDDLLLGSTAFKSCKRFASYFPENA